MLVIGLTGDIGAGKSTLAALWQEEGATLLDADALVRELWLDPCILAEVRARWGSGVFEKNGAVIRSEAARRAFANEMEYRWLCDLMHPPVMQKMERAVSMLSGFVVAEIPLLFEVGVPAWIDAIVYVTAANETRARRNAFRGLDAAALAVRESTLMPAAERIAAANMVLQNDDTLETFKEKGRALGKRFHLMSEPVEISCSFGFPEDAHRCGRMLVEKRLAASAQLHGVRSIYHWRGGVETEDESVLVLKSFERHFAAIAAFLKAEHAYEVPVIESRPLRRMNYPALEWLFEVCP